METGRTRFWEGDRVTGNGGPPGCLEGRYEGRVEREGVGLPGVTRRGDDGRHRDIDRV